MIRNYIKIAFRNLRKDILFSFINIFGLMIGLTSFILIALYVFDDFTYDKQHKNADSIYRVVNTIWIDGEFLQVARANYNIAELKNELPEIKGSARHIYWGRASVSDISEKNTFIEELRFGNSGFLEVLDFKMLQGNPATALEEPYTVIITEETAQKIFNKTDVLGELLMMDSERPYTITGILENLPSNSHLSFNLLISESTILNDEANVRYKEGWKNGRFQTYLLLQENADVASVESKINSIITTRDDDEYDRAIKLQSLTDVHFYSEGITEGYDNPSGNIYYIYAFSVIAFFVLLIACINYINLTTARYSRRAKEIAMRKVVGASKKSLIGQFLSEAYMLTFIALILALIAVIFLLPSFNTFTGKELDFNFSSDYRILIGLAFVILFVGFVSGLYPAIFLSAAKPLSLLKNKVKVGSGNLSLRRTLVVFQFSLSIIMIIATMVVFMQMQYLDSKDMGFKKDQLVVVDINSGKIREDANSIKDQFLKLSQVRNVSLTTRVPGDWKEITAVRVKNQNIQNEEGLEMYFLGVDHSFLSTYETEMLSGRNFTEGSVADSSAVILNETAAKILGITEASEQLVEIKTGQSLMLNVVGIIKDFNFQSLKEPLAPMVVGFEKNPFDPIDYFTVKVAPGDINTTLDQMDKIMQGSDQENLLEYHFLDEQWKLFYKEDVMRQTMFLILSILTILIACLGLLGLVTFEARQRIKEIGIRKVAGASVGNIIKLLSKDLLKLVFIAALISFPVAWYMMDKWLTDFAYRIDISWWIFAVAGILAITIAFITMSFQAIKAANANPVKSLRTE